jgi:hypothetical protein
VTAQAGPVVGDCQGRETSFVKRVGVFAAAMVVGIIFAGCGGGSATLPAQHDTVTVAGVCRDFNIAASPTLHSNSVYTGLAKLAADAKDADLRREGSALQTALRHHSYPGSATAIKSYYQIGAVCVSHGLTPKDWPDLI